MKIITVIGLLWALLLALVSSPEKNSDYFVKGFSIATISATLCYLMYLWN